MVEEKYLTCSYLKLPFLFISLKSTSHTMLISPILVTHAYSRNRKKIHKQLLSVCPKGTIKKKKIKKDKKERQLQSLFCYLRINNYVQYLHQNTRLLKINSNPLVGFSGPNIIQKIVW